MSKRGWSIGIILGVLIVLSLIMYIAYQKGEIEKYKAEKDNYSEELLDGDENEVETEAKENEVETVAKENEDINYDDTEEQQEELAQNTIDVRQLIGEINLNGNTNANIQNGGWVAEQGDWNYYAIDNFILKENVTTGEKKVVFTDDTANVITDLRVMGEWIYYTKDGIRICRVSIDGKNADCLYTDWADDVLTWDTWNEEVYLIIKEYMSVQTYSIYVATLNWDDATYNNVADLCASDTRFYIDWEIKPFGSTDEYYYYLGIENGYLYVFFDDSDGAYYLIAINLESQDEYLNYEQQVYKYVVPFRVGGIYLCDPYFGVMERDEEKTRGLQLIDMNGMTVFEDDFIEYHGINITEEGTILLSTTSCIESIDPITEEIHYIVLDNAYGLCVAHNKVYYECDGVYCEINNDGTDWKKINIDEFVY